MKRSAVVCAITLIAAFAPSGAPALASISVGAYVPPWEQTGVKYTQDIRAFNQGTGKNHAIILFYRGFNNTNADDTYLLAQCRDAGAVPFVNILSGWSYGSIIAGSHNDYFHAMARAFRDFGGRILMCIDSEMNLERRNPTEFISMWRHIHDIFTFEGASKVEWVWSPNYLPSNHAQYYPGDSYVHWVGTEGFCWKDGSLAAGLFGPILSSFASNYPHKPAIISYMGGDTALASYKAPWITEAYETLKGYSNLKAVIWWNDSVVTNAAYDFRVYPTSYKPSAVPAEVTSAYKNAIASSPYISTLPPYSDLTDGDGGPSGVSLTPSTTTIARGSSLTINWVIENINLRIDAYLGAMTPDGTLFIADPSLNWSTAITPIARNFNPAGNAEGTLQFQIPSSIPAGIYTLEAVIVPAGASVMSPGNWLGSGMSTSPVTIQ